MLNNFSRWFILADILAGILQPPFFYGQKAPRLKIIVYYFFDFVCYFKLLYTLD